MKKICFILLIVFCFAACGGGGDSGDGEPSIQELTLDETATGKISEVGEVDWYHINVVENDRTLSVNLSGTRQNSPVDFMITIYEKDKNGNMDVIFGESAKEDAFAPADINIDVGIRKPKHLYMAVRDFQDNEASDQISYRLTATFSDETVDNNTFENAIELPVGTGQVCHAEETIFPATDVDCFTFTIGDANPAGVYRITAQYDIQNSTTVPVNLGLELYNGSGELVQQFAGQKPGDNMYVLLPYLAEGTYYLVVADQGKNDESQYNYKICIEPMNAEEVMENDTSDPGVPDNPATAPDGDDLLANVTGSLEYIQDEDWYVFNVTPAGVGEFKTLYINFFHNFGAQIPDELNGQVKPAGYRVSVLNGDLKVIHSFDQTVLNTAPQIVELEADAGNENYIVVRPIYNDQMLMAMPYQIEVRLRGVTDATESETSIHLESGDVATGIIYKAGDVDTYDIDIAGASTPKVLEVFFHTADESEVNYVVYVIWDGNTRMLRDINGDEDGASVKSSFYIAQDLNVSLQVRDDQNNDGDDVEYTLRVNELDVPTDLSGVSNPSGVTGTVDFFDEIDERAVDPLHDPATEVTVIEFNNDSPKFMANTDKLRVPQLADDESWTFPWIAGYADYAGDRDIFQLNFADLIPQGDDPPPWHAEIQIRMIAEGSPVEYSWTLFRDRQPNNVLIERAFWVIDPETGEPVVDEDNELQYNDEGEGIVACWADENIASDFIDVTVPSDDLPPEFNSRFWIGDGWSGSDFYISINDFNYMRTRENAGDPPVVNQIPDNDWGNTNSLSLDPPYGPQAVLPYYFQVTVTYREGESYPSDD
jgi:hypothetical protein